MKRQTILIFGGTGSLGRALIKRLACENYVHVASRDENKHWTLKNELDKSLNVKFHVADVRNLARVSDLMSQINPHIVISAAALKHVDVCESIPEESIATNVVGVQNIVTACKLHARAGGRLDCVLQVSTDKACEPVNVYGMCKALSERVVTSQELAGLTKFVAVRYGNVLESRGSIIPLFRFQAENKESFTVTDPNMTRFVMTLDDSVNLIISAILRASNGETWIPRIPSMRIGDLAELFSQRYNKPITYIPVRPGEKQHEDLIGRTEATRTYAVSDKHYVIKPINSHVFDANCETNTAVSKYSSSDDVMTKDMLEHHLDKLGVLTAAMSTFKGQSIEEIRTS